MKPRTITREEALEQVLAWVPVGTVLDFSDIMRLCSEARGKYQFMAKELSRFLIRSYKVKRIVHKKWMRIDEPSPRMELK